MKRLFFALWPSQTIRDQLVAVNAHIGLAGVRKLKPENLHLTLLYLGETSSKHQAEIVAQVNDLRPEAFTFQLDGLAYWEVPKIVCLTVGQQPSAMLRLVDQLTNIARHYPIYLHDRPFQGHVTLMRKAKKNTLIWCLNRFSGKLKHLCWLSLAPQRKEYNTLCWRSGH